MAMYNRTTVDKEFTRRLPLAIPAVFMSWLPGTLIGLAFDIPAFVGGIGFVGAVLVVLWLLASKAADYENSRAPKTWEPEFIGPPAPSWREMQRRSRPQYDKPFVPRGEYLAQRRKESEEFYKSQAWREVRYQALVLHGAKCQCCGRSRKDGVVIHVDHIKPRSKFPALALTLTNLQVMCDDCNIGKSNKDDTDWR